MVLRLVESPKQHYQLDCRWAECRSLPCKTHRLILPTAVLVPPVYRRGSLQPDQSAVHALATAAPA